MAETLDTAIQASPELLQYAKSLKSKSSVAQTPAAKEGKPSKVFNSDVDRPGYHFDENPANYAVVVGVESYANVASAEFAKRDAEAMRAHLRALGYPGQNIILLTDAQATGNKLKSYVESWLPRNDVKPESKVFVYFAGHGAPDPESKQAYLMLWDGDPQYVSDTGYPLKRLYQKLNGSKSRKWSWRWTPLHRRRRTLGPGQGRAAPGGQDRLWRRLGAGQGRGPDGGGGRRGRRQRSRRGPWALHLLPAQEPQ